jgi:hypothetical protein
VDNGYDRYYPIHINSYDTNGVNNRPVRYYWQGAGQSFDTTRSEPLPLRKTNKDTVHWYFESPNPATPNVAKQFWIAALDDDGLLRGRMSGTPFVVFADSAPPRPSSLLPGTSGQNTVLKWQNTTDAKDGMKTQVQIYVCNGIVCDPSTPLFTGEWPTLDDARFGTEGSRFTYTFDCSFSGDGNFKVAYKDARGTISESNVAAFTAP